MSELVPFHRPVTGEVVRERAPSNILNELSEAGYQMVLEGTADNTRRAYKMRQKSFNHYLVSRSLPLLHEAPVSPAVLIEWMDHQSRHRVPETGDLMAPATVALTVAAVRAYARAMMDVDPTWVVPDSNHLKTAYQVYCKRWFKAGNRVRQATPTTFEELRVYSAGIDRSTPRGQRNIAIILLGFWMAARASEVSAVWTSDDDRNIRFSGRAMQVYIPYSKTDQAAVGVWATIPRYDAEPDICAVRAVSEWREQLRTVGHVNGRLFVEMPVGKRPDLFAEGMPGLGPVGVSDITARWAQKLGIGRRSAHSHRRGAATEAYLRKATVKQIMKMGRWSSALTVMRYIDDMAYSHPLA